MTLVYLDNNATTPLDSAVLKAMLPYLSDWYGNAASAHVFGWESEAAVEAAREQVATLVGADADEVFFTSGATEANNWFLQRFAFADRRTFVTSPIEHKSVLQPLASGRAQVTLLPVNAYGEVQLHCASANGNEASDGRAILSLMGVNNEIHSVLDFRAARAFCDRIGAVFHSDATQLVGRMPIDMQQMGIDALSLSSHKVYGPKGIGALCIRRLLHKELRPLIEGGGQESGFRAGTTPVPLVVGFGKACELARASLATEPARLNGLVEVFLNRLDWHGLTLTIVGPPQLDHRQPGSLSLQIEGLQAERLCELVPEVAVSQSSACNSNGVGSHVLQAIGMDRETSLRTFRLSFGRFNSEEDAIYAANRFAEAAKNHKPSHEARR